MAYTVTLDIPDKIAQNARSVAVRTRRPIDDVLLTWLDRMADEVPVEDLSDEQVLSLSTMELAPAMQAELSELLAVNREGMVTSQQRSRLDELMQVYRHNLIRKAQAVKAAVERGLRPALHGQAG
ncbi:MAG: hypothetical protein DYG89_01055 [Caldilinea sp. CFX5]|nr:hypothetical protein [Caldilinea sp. CFX5]